jgi:hypothetical protein
VGPLALSLRQMPATNSVAASARTRRSGACRHATSCGCECLANRSRIFPGCGYEVTLRCGRDLLRGLFDGGPSPALSWWPSR